MLREYSTTSCLCSQAETPFRGTYALPRWSRFQIGRSFSRLIRRITPSSRCTKGCCIQLRRLQLLPTESFGDLLDLTWKYSRWFKRSTNRTLIYGLWPLITMGGCLKNGSIESSGLLSCCILRCEEEWLSGKLANLAAHDVEQTVDDNFKVCSLFESWVYLRNLWKFRMCGDPVVFWRETLWKQRLLGQDSYKAFKSFEGSPNPQKVAQELRQAVQAFKKNMPIIQAWISWIIPVSNDNASQLIVSWWPVMWWLFVYFGGLYCLQLKRWEPVYLAL